jgi:hypothetical protein
MVSAAVSYRGSQRCVSKDARRRSPAIDLKMTMATEAKLLTLQFLQWLAARPRRHAEVRSAWSSTCPLNCAFEDAVSDDLVERCPDGHLILTERGRARLAEAAGSAPTPSP